MDSVAGGDDERRKREKSTTNKPTTGIVVDLGETYVPYIPGTGPPLPPISLLPHHDNTDHRILKEWLVPRSKSHDGKAHVEYLVGTSKGGRVVADAAEILDYISPRALETWHRASYHKKEEAARKLEEEENLRLVQQAIEAEKKQQAKLGRTSSSGSAPKKTNADGTMPKRRGRPPKVKPHHEKAPSLSAGVPSLSSSVAASVPDALMQSALAATIADSEEDGYGIGSDENASAEIGTSIPDEMDGDGDEGGGGDDDDIQQQLQEDNSRNEEELSQSGSEHGFSALNNSKKPNPTIKGDAMRNQTTSTAADEGTKRVHSTSPDAPRKKTKMSYSLSGYHKTPEVSARDSTSPLVIVTKTSSTEPSLSSNLDGQQRPAASPSSVEVSQISAPGHSPMRSQSGTASGEPEETAQSPRAKQMTGCPGAEEDSSTAPKPRKSPVSYTDPPDDVWKYMKEPRKSKKKTAEPAQQLQGPQPGEKIQKTQDASATLRSPGKPVPEPRTGTDLQKKQDIRLPSLAEAEGPSHDTNDAFPTEISRRILTIIEHEDYLNSKGKNTTRYLVKWKEPLKSSALHQPPSWVRARHMPASILQNYKDRIAQKRRRERDVKTTREGSSQPGQGQSPEKRSLPPNDRDGEAQDQTSKGKAKAKEHVVPHGKPASGKVRKKSKEQHEIVESSERPQLTWEMAMAKRFGGK